MKEAKPPCPLPEAGAGANRRTAPSLRFSGVPGLWPEARTCLLRRSRKPFCLRESSFMTFCPSQGFCLSSPCSSWTALIGSWKRLARGACSGEPDDRLSPRGWTNCRSSPAPGDSPDIDAEGGVAQVWAGPREAVPGLWWGLFWRFGGWILKIHSFSGLVEIFERGRDVVPSCSFRLRSGLGRRCGTNGQERSGQESGHQTKESTRRRVDWR